MLTSHEGEIGNIASNQRTSKDLDSSPGATEGWQEDDGWLGGLVEKQAGVIRRGGANDS